MPSILEADESSKEHRKNWARLIQKIYEVDSLICPKRSGEMKVISVIEDEEVADYYEDGLKVAATISCAACVFDTQ